MPSISFLKHTMHLVSQGLCTCYFLCPKWIFSKIFIGLLSHFIQVFDQIFLHHRGLPWPSYVRSPIVLSWVFIFCSFNHFYFSSFYSSWPSITLYFYLCIIYQLYLHISSMRAWTLCGFCLLLHPYCLVQCLPYT